MKLVSSEKPPNTQVNTEKDSVLTQNFPEIFMFLSFL